MLIPFLTNHPVVKPAKILCILILQHVQHVRIPSSPILQLVSIAPIRFMLNPLVAKPARTLCILILQLV